MWNVWFFIKNAIVTFVFAHQLVFGGILTIFDRELVGNQSTPAPISSDFRNAMRPMYRPDAQ